MLTRQCESIEAALRTGRGAGRALRHPTGCKCQALCQALPHTALPPHTAEDRAPAVRLLELRDPRLGASKPLSSTWWQSGPLVLWVLPLESSHVCQEPPGHPQLAVAVPVFQPSAVLA